MKPIVSIITVCYNAEQDLKKTIESVRNQTYKNIDYVIVDGASKDGSVEVIKQFFPYITLQKQTTATGKKRCSLLLMKTVCGKA